jgi:hypothetical protein
MLGRTALLLRAEAGSTIVKGALTSCFNSNAPRTSPK